MGLFKNLRLLFSEPLHLRMLELERRQELLEDYTDQKLDSMKSYSARVLKRERDAAPSPRINDREVPHGVEPPSGLSARAAALVARRASRLGSRRGVDGGIDAVR